MAVRAAVCEGFHIALVKAMQPGEFRVTLEWGLNSRDLDSHVYFGLGEACHVYHGKLHLNGDSCPNGQGGGQKRCTF